MAKIKLSDIREGSIVMVKGGFGQERAKEAIVENAEEDIKNGMPGLDYREVESNEARWCYLDQVQSVVTY